MDTRFVFEYQLIVQALSDETDRLLTVRKEFDIEFSRGEGVYSTYQLQFLGYTIGCIDSKIDDIKKLTKENETILCDMHCLNSIVRQQAWVDGERNMLAATTLMLTGKALREDVTPKLKKYKDLHP
jgi:hypothetical protein